MNGWLDRYPEGGLIQNNPQAPTLYTSDPNDIRLKMYSDSSTSYKNSLILNDLANKFYDERGGGATRDEWNTFYKPFLDKYPVNMKLETGQYKHRAGVNSDTHNEIWNFDFKKPVQPVIYQPKQVSNNKPFKPVLSAGTVTNSSGQSFPKLLTNQQEPKINLLPKKNVDWLGAYDDSVFNVTRNPETKDQREITHLNKNTEPNYDTTYSLEGYNNPYWDNYHWYRQKENQNILQTKPVNIQPLNSKSKYTIQTQDGSIAFPDQQSLEEAVQTYDTKRVKHTNRPLAPVPDYRNKANTEINYSFPFAKKSDIIQFGDGGKVSKKDRKEADLQVQAYSQNLKDNDFTNPNDNLGLNLLDQPINLDILQANQNIQDKLNFIQYLKNYNTQLKAKTQPNWLNKYKSI